MQKKSQPTGLPEHLAGMQAALRAEMEAELAAPNPNPASPEPSAPMPEEFQDFRRFSGSRIWELQRAFFLREAQQAWTKGVVPHYVTSNSFIARAYAEVVLVFLKECAEKSPGQTLTLVELGAGSGQFAFHFLHHFLPMYREELAERIGFRYVVTDLVPGNLEFWREHSHFQEWVEAGILDFSLFDAESDKELNLVQSGLRISPEAPCGPMVLFGNYFFDGLPMDVFSFDQAKMEEVQVRLERNPGDTALDDPAILKDLNLKYRKVVAEAAYYEENELNALLNVYRESITEGFLQFPVTGIRCIQRLKKLSEGPLLLLSADKGQFDLRQVSRQGLPGLAIHGSFSFTVNYHSLLQGISESAEDILIPEHLHESLCVVGWLQDAAQYPKTQAAYLREISAFGPDGFFTLKRSIERNFPLMSAGELLSYLKLTGFDPKALRRALPHFIRLSEKFNPAQVQTLREIILKSWANYFPLGEKPDFPGMIGGTLTQFGLWEEAAFYYHQSLEMHGPEAETLYCLSKCFGALGEPERAREMLEYCLRVEPGYLEALAAAKAEAN